MTAEVAYLLLWPETNLVLSYSDPSYLFPSLFLFPSNDIGLLLFSASCCCCCCCDDNDIAVFPSNPNSMTTSILFPFRAICAGGGAAAVPRGMEATWSMIDDEEGTPPWWCRLGFTSSWTCKSCPCLLLHHSSWCCCCCLLRKHQKKNPMEEETPIAAAVVVGRVAGGTILYCVGSFIYSIK